MAVIIVPDKGLASEIGRQLLTLARDPAEVMWVSWPQAGFKVSEDLAAKFEMSQKVDALVEAEDKSVPRKRGRPPKNRDVPVVDADNNSEEG